jgi:hypothetical protein
MASFMGEPEGILLRGLIGRLISGAWQIGRLERQKADLIFSRKAKEG